MNRKTFDAKVRKLFADHKRFISRKNVRVKETNGVYCRYKYPVLTAEHTPVFWRYDLDYKTNPFLCERLGVNCAFNPGAIEFEGKICLAVRVEGADRKSFFAIAESKTGVDGFKFWDYRI
jgi:4-O-beta-D-mannosyl-D-glucose phosphorylase